MSDLVNDLLRLVLLAEVHDDILSVEMAKNLFGDSVFEDFCRTYPDIPCDDGYVGQGSRKIASNRRRVSTRKMEQSRVYAKRLASLPWVRFVGVTGSVAYGNAEEGDDIDFFLVVKNNRLWLARLYEQISYRISGIRRSYGDEYVKDKVCINYYCSEDNLDLREDGKDDFLSAAEIVVMRPILHETFLKCVYADNDWICDFFPNISIEKSEAVKDGEDPVVAKLFDMGDAAIRYLWLGYMKFMRHPVDDAVLERNKIQFFDQKRWNKRQKALQNKLKLYDV